MIEVLKCNKWLQKLNLHFRDFELALVLKMLTMMVRLEIVQIKFKS